MHYLESLFAPLTILVSAWIIFVTLRDPSRWTYQTDTSKMKDMPLWFARITAVLFIILAVIYWIVI